MKINRYPGVKPFSYSERNLFFGRKYDIEQLFNLSMLEKLVVLHGKSGYGKSSLIQAGLLPKLTETANYTPFVIRFGSFVGQSESEEATNPQLLLETMSKRIDMQVTEKKLLRNSASLQIFERHPQTRNNRLWLQLKQLQTEGQNRFFIIFDQFEEIFSYPEAAQTEFRRQLVETLYSETPKAVRTVYRQLAEEDVFDTDQRKLMETPFELRIIFGIRSDRLSLLNKFTDYLPSVLRHCYELGALTREQATEAIVTPARFKPFQGLKPLERLDESIEFISDPFEFDPLALNQILDHLTNQNTQNVESFQLQIICQYCESLIIERQINKIDTKLNSKLMYRVLSTDLGDISGVFKNHYNLLLFKLPKQEWQLAARRLIEDQLIVDGIRVTLPDVVVMKQTGVTSELMQLLVNSHLLRSEPNMVQGISYELCHDTMVKPILEERDKRLTEELRRKEEQDRKEEEQRLKEKLEQEQAERAKERKRQRTIIYIVSVAAVISISLAVLAMIKMKEAQELTIKMYAKEALAHFDAERYMSARQKYEYMRDTLNVSEDSLSISIAKCNNFDSISKLFYNTLTHADTLLKSDNISSLVNIDSLYKFASTLDYKPGLKILKAKTDSHKERIKRTISENIEIAKSYLKAGAYLHEDAKIILLNLLKLEPYNTEIIQLLTELK
jgi:hypothetical protein